MVYGSFVVRETTGKSLEEMEAVFGTVGQLDTLNSSIPRLRKTSMSTAWITSDRPVINFAFTFLW